MDRTHHYERCNEIRIRTRCLLKLNWSWLFVVVFLFSVAKIVLSFLFFFSYTMEDFEHGQWYWCARESVLWTVQHINIYRVNRWQFSSNVSMKWSIFMRWYRDSTVFGSYFPFTNTTIRHLTNCAIARDVSMYVCMVLFILHLKSENFQYETLTK